MADLGMFGITVPEALGGVGADVVSYACVMEELSRGYASVADQCGLVELVATLLAEHGTAEQQERYLRPLLRAERRCAYAITEAEAGSDVSSIQTIAAETPEGWRLTGGKLWIHNAPFADFAVVLARSAPDLGRRGMSIFLVDRDRPGYRIGRKEHKMGQRASPVGALHFDGVELPKEALLGPLNRGFPMMMSVLDKGRVGIAALAVGILQAALEASVDYAKQRRQFGKAIAEFQAVQWMLADMAKDLHAARLMTLDAAARMDRGERRRRSARWQNASRPTPRSCIRRTRCRSMAAWATSGASRSSGSMRDAKITQIYEGTNQIQRMIIARRLLA